VTTQGFARFGVGGDDVAFTLARILSLAIVGRSRSLAGALPFARVPTEAFELGGLGRCTRRVLGTYHAASESQRDRGREHHSCYRVFLHRGDLLSSLKSSDSRSRGFLAFDRAKGRDSSDLKITFARFGTLLVCLPGFDLHRFNLVVDLVESMLKFRRLYFHTDVTALAYDMSFRVLFDFPHQQRILEAALRTRNVYRFVFKHIETSQRYYKICGDT
jgi:hypothetical protein